MVARGILSILLLVSIWTITPGVMADELPDLAGGMQDLADFSGVMKELVDLISVVVAIGLCIFGVYSAVLRQNFLVMLMYTAAGFGIYLMPTVIGMLTLSEVAPVEDSKPVDDGFPFLPFLILLAISSVFFFAPLFSNFFNSDSDEAVTDRLAEQPSNDPLTVDELRERQQQNSENQPVVVNSTSSQKKHKVEPVEVQPGKRKIILD